ncbi:MAG: TIGR03960 family B12-binding radical SAM protein [Sedimentisphaerales bacterium]|nr:TIGR03960 family B12-binding radical SAM protein [Sedimentisphaerales bacterium]
MDCLFRYNTSMKNKQPGIVDELVRRRFLPFVRRPGRYIGGEVNQIQKDLSHCDVRIALCFPDVYEIGMSYTGMSILYGVLNRMEGVAAERVFAPWTDAEEVMRREEIPLFSLESRAVVGDFDMIGFSLTNELCYTTMLNMIDLAGIPLRSVDRGQEDSIIVAGGQAANCCEPVAPFVDLFVLGEAEDEAARLVRLYRKCQAADLSRRDFLVEAARLSESVYVPALYTFEYEKDRIKDFRSLVSQVPMRLANAIVQNFDAAPVPDKPIVPFVQAVHERAGIEVMRGCPGRCRFCQASFCRRPIRFRSVNRIVEIAEAQIAATGFDTIGLLSLSTADYPDLEELVDTLNARFAPHHIGLSLPSLKVQTQLKLLPKMVSTVRKAGLTIAVEAASERLRQVINKPISNEDLKEGIRAAFEAGFRKVKLYFMVGLPGEAEDDILGIVDLAHEISGLRRGIDGKFAEVNAAVSWLVPKPHTPFGWLGQQSQTYFENARRILLDRKKELRARYVHLKFHNIAMSVLESAIGKGDRRLADVIETAWRSGARFDLWDECFDMDRWKQAFASHGLDLNAAAQRSFSTEDYLPWQHLGGPSIDSLLEHYQQALEQAAQSSADI